MKRGIAYWKAQAREALRGKYAVAILAILAVTIVNFAANNLMGYLFPENTVLNLILSQVFALALSLVVAIFTAGMSYMYLKMARGESFSMGDLLYFFRNNPDRVIVATFVMALLELAVSIPANLYGFFVPVGNTADAQMAWLYRYFLLLLLAVVLQEVLTLPFAVTYYILADNQDLNGMDALKKSIRMMKGYKGKYLLLEISFLPWLVVSMFTMGLLLLWLMPYMAMTEATFYRELHGEFNPPAAAAEPEYGVFLQANSSVGDDYNSEA